MCKWNACNSWLLSNMITSTFKVSECFRYGQICSDGFLNQTNWGRAWFFVKTFHTDPLISVTIVNHMPWWEVFPEPALGADRQQALAYHIYCAPGRSNTSFTWNTRCQLRHLREVMVTIGQLGYCAMLLNRFSMLGQPSAQSWWTWPAVPKVNAHCFIFIKIPRLKMNSMSSFHIVSAVLTDTGRHQLGFDAFDMKVCDRTSKS